MKSKFALLILSFVLMTGFSVSSKTAFENKTTAIDERCILACNDNVQAVENAFEFNQNMSYCAPVEYATCKDINICQLLSVPPISDTGKVYRWRKDERIRLLPGHINYLKIPPAVRS